MILVTGGTGLTGQFVVEDLLRRGHEVRVLCRTEPSDRTLAGRVEIAVGDLRDPESLRRATRGASGIVHAACTFTDSAVDIAAMEDLLAGWQTGPFVFISSLDVYGFAGPGPITETTPVSESYTDYSRGKVVCERLLVEAAGRAGRSDHVALRAPYIWGPHPTAHKRLVVQRLLDHQPIVLPGIDHAEWTQYQDVWIDVRDLATIVGESVARPAGGPLNALTGHFVWHDLYAELIRLTRSRSELVHKPLDAITDDELPRKHLYAQKWRFSEDRLGRHLGSIPRRAFDVTLRDTVMSRSSERDTSNEGA